jgi:hypothetical protein
LKKFLVILFLIFSAAFFAFSLSSLNEAPVSEARLVAPPTAPIASAVQSAIEARQVFKLGNLGEQLGVPALDDPASLASRPNASAPSTGASASVPDDRECRDRMKKLGIVSNGPCIDVSDIVENLSQGDYKFNDPKKAYVGEPFTIRLVLKTSDQQDVQVRFAGTPGDVVTKSGKFAQSLEATLHGEDFDVKPPGPLERTATLAAPVEWEWRATALSGGTKTLTVDVVANIQAGPDKHKVQITTLYEPLIIQVSLFHRAKEYVAEANGLVIAAGTAIPALLAIFGFVPKARGGVVSAWNWLRRKPSGNRAARRAAASRQRRSS